MASKSFHNYKYPVGNYILLLFIPQDLFPTPWQGWTRYSISIQRKTRVVCHLSGYYFQAWQLTWNWSVHKGYTNGSGRGNRSSIQACGCALNSKRPPIITENRWHTRNQVLWVLWSRKKQLKNRTVYKLRRSVDRYLQTRGQYFADGWKIFRRTRLVLRLLPLVRYPYPALPFLHLQTT